MKMTKKRIKIFLTIAVIVTISFIAGINHISHKRYEFPFHTEMIDYITLENSEAGCKDLRDKKDIQKIVSTLQSLKTYSWKEMDSVDGNDSMSFLFHLSDGTEEEVSYAVMIGRKDALYDKTGEIRVSHFPVEKLWDKFHVEEYHTPLWLITDEDAQNIETITAAYSNGTRVTISDPQAVRKIASEIQGVHPVQEIEPAEEPEENGIDVMLSIKNKDAIGFHYFPEYIMQDQLSGFKMKLELPALKEALAQEIQKKNIG